MLVLADQEQIESSYNTTTANNRGYDSASALQIRLDTTTIIENVEMFLKGSKLTVYQDEKGIHTKKVNTGTPKANDAGIQSILNWLQLILNPQVVQGNFPSDGKGHSPMYDDYIYWTRINLSNDVIENCYSWAVSDSDIDGIINSIMNIVEPFMTRLIDNKERESYEHTVKHLEHNTLRESGNGGLKLFGDNHQ